LDGAAVSAQPEVAVAIATAAATAALAMAIPCRKVMYRGYTGGSEKVPD